jgi:hypothetical protein
MATITENIAVIAATVIGSLLFRVMLNRIWPGKSDALITI